jgi:hypothetical protein
MASLSTGSPDQIRINNYNGQYYINGISRVIQQDISLHDCLINFIDVPFEIPKLSTDSCGTCNKLSSVKQSIYDDFNLSLMRQLLESSDPSIFDWDTPPYTILALSNGAFQGQPKLFDYLIYNKTTLHEFLRLYVIDGTYYPSAAGMTVANSAGNNIVFSGPGSTDMVFSDQNDDQSSAQGVAYPRLDGVYYVLDNFVFEIFNAEIPDSPVAPVPTYTLPVPAPIFDTTGVEHNLVNLVLLMIGLLLVFIIQ